MEKSKFFGASSDSDTDNNNENENSSANTSDSDQTSLDKSIEFENGKLENFDGITTQNSHALRYSDDEISFAESIVNNFIKKSTVVIPPPDLFIKIPRAITVKYKGDKITLLDREILNIVIELVKSKINEIDNETTGNFKYAAHEGSQVKPKKLSSKPAAWLSEAMHLKQGQTVTKDLIKLQRAEFIERIKNKYKLGEFDFSNLDDWSDALEEEKTKVGVEMPEETREIYYSMAGRTIRLITPSDRYAADWGKTKDLTQLIDMTNLFLKLNYEININSNHTVSQLPSNSPLSRLHRLIIGIAAGARIKVDMLSSIMAAVGLINIQQYKANEIRPEDAYGNTRLSYREMYYNGIKNLKPHDVAKQIRAILKGADSLEIVKSESDAGKIIPCLIAALFLSEVSRNPTSLLSSLILLDFIESGITFAPNEPYTWRNSLWHPNTIDLDENSANERSKKFPNENRWGGHHPMAHLGSFEEEFIEDNWQMDEPLTIARQKEAAIILRWLSHTLDISLEPTLFTEEITEALKKDSQLKSDKKQTVIERFIKPALHKRLESFDNLLSKKIEDNEVNSKCFYTTVADTTEPTMEIIQIIQKTMSTAKQKNSTAIHQAPSSIFLQPAPVIQRAPLNKEAQVKIWLKSKNIPECLQLGVAIGKGDCFFDVIAQGLNNSEGKDVYDVKSLRLFCQEYANKSHNTWVKAAINYDEQDKDNEKGSYEMYLARICFTAEEMAQHEREGTLSKVETAIYGRPKIEGRMFCDAYGIQLHIIEIQENGEMISYLVDANGEGEDINPIIDYNNPKILHIVNYHNHYVPLLDTTKVNLLQQPMTRFNEQPYYHRINHDSLSSSPTSQRSLKSLPEREAIKVTYTREKYTLLKSDTSLEALEKVVSSYIITANKVRFGHWAGQLPRYLREIQFEINKLKYNEYTIVEKISILRDTIKYTRKLGNKHPITLALKKYHINLTNFYNSVLEAIKLLKAELPIPQIDNNSNSYSFKNKEKADRLHHFLTQLKVISIDKEIMHRQSDLENPEEAYVIKLTSNEYNNLRRLLNNEIYINVPNIAPF